MKTSICWIFFAVLGFFVTILWTTFRPVFGTVLNRAPRVGVVGGGDGAGVAPRQEGPETIRPHDQLIPWELRLFCQQSGVQFNCLPWFEFWFTTQQNDIWITGYKGLDWILSSTIFPTCPAPSAEFPSAQTEQWEPKKNPSVPNPGLPPDGPPCTLTENVSEVSTNC